MKEVVDKIRAAEKKAAELKAEAVSEAEYNLKKVREKGKKYVDDTVASAHDKAGRGRNRRGCCRKNKRGR